MARRHGTLTLRREDGRIVTERVKLADTWPRRMVGLLGRRRVGHEEGVVLRPAFSIHTFFMRFPIDAVFLDHDLVVLRIAERLRPFRTASCRGAREVVELRAGECERRGLAVGDHVAWASASQVVAGTAAAAPTALHVERFGRAIVASPDARFSKLAKFMLDAKGIEVSESVTPERLADYAVDEEGLDVVLFDTGNHLAEGLRTLNILRAERPELPVILAGEEASDRAPAGVRVYHRWNETEELIAAVADAIQASEPAIGEPEQ